MISHSLSGMQTQRGDTGQQLPMSENRRAATSALVSLTGMVCMLLGLHLPLLVTLQYSHINVCCFLPTTKDVCRQYVMCGHLFLTEPLLAVKHCHINFTEVKQKPSQSAQFN